MRRGIIIYFHGSPHRTHRTSEPQFRTSFAKGWEMVHMIMWRFIVAATLVGLLEMASAFVKPIYTGMALPRQTSTFNQVRGNDSYLKIKSPFLHQQRSSTPCLNRKPPAPRPPSVIPCAAADIPYDVHRLNIHFCNIHCYLWFGQASSVVRQATAVDLSDPRVKEMPQNRDRPDKYTGACFVVKDNIDTDQIIPAEFLTLVPSKV